MVQELLSQLFENYVSEIKKLSSIDNFYDYEKKFSELHNTLGKQVLEQSLATVGDSRKKVLTCFGCISISSGHSFSGSKNGFKISPLMQYLILSTSVENPSVSAKA